MNITRRTTILPGDIIKFDFGSNTIKSATKGVRPAYVVTVTDSRIYNARMMVIPLYPTQSRYNPESDVPIKQIYCHGLTRDQYLNPGNLTRVERYRATERIGHIHDKNILDQISRAIRREVGVDNG